MFTLSKISLNIRWKEPTLEWIWQWERILIYFKDLPGSMKVDLEVRRGSVNTYWMNELVSKCCCSSLAEYSFNFESESVGSSEVSASLWPHGLSMEFSRQEYWSGLPFPSPGDLPNPGIKPRSPTLQADSSPSEPAMKPYILTLSLYKRGKNLVFLSGSVSLLSSANICYLLISDIAFVLKSLKSGVKWKFKEAIHRDDSEVTKTTNKYTTYTHMKDI